jgi:hypothetical protein
VSQFYHTLDQDGKGYVTLEELEHYFKHTGLKAQVKQRLPLETSPADERNSTLSGIACGGVCPCYRTTQLSEDHSLTLVLTWWWGDTSRQHSRISCAR